MSNFKNPPISFHPTLTDTLKVNWKQEYNGEFICPQCNKGRLNNSFYAKTVTCKIRLRCNYCKKNTSLSCSLVKNSPISFHSTLNEPLRVNWKQEYHKEFTCPKCNRAKIENFISHKKSNHKLRIRCYSCNQTTALSCLISEYPAISSHPTLQERLEVNWKKEYNNEFICPKCNRGTLNKFAHKNSSLCKLTLKCNQCYKTTNLTCHKNPEHPRISIHSTLKEKLEVDWETEYHNEFTCPQCNKGYLNQLKYSKGAACKLILGCHVCNKTTSLTCQLRRYPVVSIHETLFDELQVDWEKEYSNEFICFKCERGKLAKFFYRQGLHNVRLRCQSCRKTTTLSCQVSPHIHGYRPDLICPNPLCTQLGHDGQKGWIYETFNREKSNCDSNCRCYFCGINFKPNAQSNSSWVSRIKIDYYLFVLKIIFGTFGILLTSHKLKNLTLVLLNSNGIENKLKDT